MSPADGSPRSSTRATGRPGPRPAARTPSGEPVATTSARRIVVLVSGTGTNLAALLAAHDDPAYGARVVGVVADKAGIGGLAIARDAGVATAVVSPGDFVDRSGWDAALAEAIAVFRPDLVVSAGFMRILGAAVLDRFPARILNTHPALLPAFPGAHAVRDALAHGVKVTGCSVIVVDEGVDSGPIVAQVPVPMVDDDDEGSLHERIKVAERTLLVDVVGRILREGLTVDGRKASLGAG